MGYNFSGSFDVAGGCTGSFCGAYTGMITIEDTQTGTPASNTHIYVYDQLMVTLFDGTVLSESNTTFNVNNTSFPLQEVSIGLADMGFEIGLFWQFQPGTFDISKLTDILTALTDFSVPPDVQALATIGDPDEVCPSPCSGSLSALTEKPSGIPEPSTIALLSLGLAGLGFTRRRMKV